MGILLYRLLCGCHGVNGGHKTLNDFKVVVDDFGNRGQAVGRAAGIRDNMHGGLKCKIMLFWKVVENSCHFKIVVSKLEFSLIVNENHKHQGQFPNIVQKFFSEYCIMNAARESNKKAYH